MAKSYCTHFPNCVSLAGRFGVPTNILNIYINLYNRNVGPEERISPDVNYTDEQLGEIYDKISRQRAERKATPAYKSQEKGMLIASIGGPEAMAYTQATAVFSAGEIEDITDEMSRLVIDKLTAVANSHEKSDNSIEKLLNKLGSNAITAVFNMVVKSYLDKQKQIKSILDVIDSKRAQGETVTPLEVDPYCGIESEQQAREIYSKLDKLFSEGKYVGRIYESLAVLSLNTLNKVLGVRIHGDFTLDSTDSVSYEVAESIRDMEEPTQDRWQESLDAQNLEDSLSAIVARVLMQVPKTKVTVENEVREVTKNGETFPEMNPVVRKEVAKSSIFGIPLYSNPQVVARRLFNILAHCTGEQDMMTSLRDAGYDEIYNLLVANHTLRTTFWQQFNKYSQQYRKVDTYNGGANVISLGRSSRDEAISNFRQCLKNGNISDNSIYQMIEENGESKPALKFYGNKSGIYGVKKWFNENFQAAEGKPSNFELSSPSAKESLLISLMDFLNLPISEKGVGVLLSDSSKLNSFITAASTFLEEADSMLSTGFSRYQKRVNRFISSPKLKAPLTTMINLVQGTPRTTYNTRVTYSGSSLSTIIYNSPLAILAKKVNSLNDTVRDGRPDRKLTDYLNYRYLDSRQYMLGGRVLNRWLSDFLMCADAVDTECAKSIFGFTRDLGIDDVRFEDISDRKHMLMFLHGYLGGRSFGDSVATANSEKEAFDISVSSGNRTKKVVVLGTPFYYLDGHKMYRTDTAYIPSFITGDTNALRQVRTIHYYQDEVLSGMYGMFLSDKENQSVIDYFNSLGIVFSANGKEAYTSRKSGKKRVSNANKFGLLQFLNDEKPGTGKTWYEHFILEAAKAQGLNVDSVSKLTSEQITSLEGDENTFKRVAADYLAEGFKDFRGQLNDLGLLQKDANGKYVNFDKYLGNEESTKDEILDEILMDFYLDYKFGQYNLAHLMHVNPLFFNGVEEQQKRNKATLTTGDTLSMEARDRDGNSLWGYNPETGTYDFNSKVVYFKDVKAGIDKKSRDYLVRYFTRLFSRTMSAEDAARAAGKHVSEFDSNSLTDGQAYRSFESYRKILMSAGKSHWTDAHEDAYNRIMAIVTPVREARRRGKDVALTVEQIQAVENLMAIMQPIKPINDGIESLPTSLGSIKVGFQFKYAEVPIIPELLPLGSKLREMGDMMVDLGIDMMASDKCLKKGSWGEMDLQYKMVSGKYVDAKGEFLPGMDENGKIIDDGTQTAAQQRANPNNDKKFVGWEEGTSVKDIFRAHATEDGSAGYMVHNIPMENYLLQGNIPDHTDGNVILGTQPRKIGTGAIINSENYNYTIGPKGTKISGKHLARLYGAAHSVKFAKSYGKFAGRINNVSEIVSDLIFNLINNGRGNLSSIEKLALVDGVNPTISFAEPSIGNEVRNSLISLFKKTVIRQLISGGSLVQASSLGYGKRALEDTGLHATFNEDGVPTGMQTEMPFDFHYTDDQGNMVDLKFEDYCDENGYFLDREGNPIMEDRYDQLDELAVIAQDFPGILDIVAYRIPTEMEYSMFHLKIVKCNPKSANNTIKLPAECTTIAGFDFDIDKLFLMRRNFRAKEAVSEEQVWEHFYDKNEDVRQALGAAWKAAGDKSKKWHEYWPTVMQANPSWDTRFESKKKEYQKAKDELQRSKVDKSPIDYNMSVDRLAELSQSELDNILIDCMIAILSDESTVGDRYAIGGFDGASHDAKALRLIEAGKMEEDETVDEFDKRVDSMEDVKPNYDYSEPHTSIVFKSQNQIAGTLIGIFANDNVNEFISKGLKTLSISDPKNRIVFGSLMKVTEVDGKPGSTDDIGMNFLHTTVNGKSIKRTLAELLAAAVDAVKDPVLNYLNLNSITADAAAMLVRLGYSTRDIGLLFNQPVIKKMCEYMSREGENNSRRALVKVLSDMGSANPAGLFMGDGMASPEYLTSEALAKNIALFAKEGKVDIKAQEAIAQMFHSIMQTKSEFSNYIQQTRNTSANTVKARFEDYLSTKGKSGREFNRINIQTSDTIGHPITGGITEEDLTNPEKLKELLTEMQDHPFLYENIVASIIDLGMEKMMNKFTLYTTPKYTRYRNILTNLVAPWGLTGDQIQALYADIPVMELSELEGDFNPTYKSDGETANAIKYVDENQFMKETRDYLLEHLDLMDLPILAALDYESVSQNNDAYRFTLKYSRSISQWEKAAISLSWAYLMSLGGKEAKIAKGLFLHFYYTRGLNPSSNFFMELAPVNVLNALNADDFNSYVDFFDLDSDIYKETGADSALSIRKKLYQFILSHNSDPSMVRTVNVDLKDCKAANSEEAIFLIKKGRKTRQIKNDGDLVRLQTVKRGGRNVGAFVAPVIRLGGQIYVLAKQECGEYVVNYDNYIDYGKYRNIDEIPIKYIPVISLKADEKTEDIHEKLSSHITAQNSIIYKNTPNAVPMDNIINADSVVTDNTESGSSVDEAYDNAEEKTEDDNVVSEDGREQCHTRNVQNQS